MPSCRVSWSLCCFRNGGINGGILNISWPKMGGMSFVLFLCMWQKGNVLSPKKISEDIIFYAKLPITACCLVYSARAHLISQCPELLYFQKCCVLSNSAPAPPGYFPANWQGGDGGRWTLRISYKGLAPGRASYIHHLRQLRHKASSRNSEVKQGTTWNKTWHLWFLFSVYMCAFM